MTSTNWAGNLAFAAAAPHEPTSIPELQRLVARSRSLRALGSRHSFNAIADGAEQVSVARLARELVIDAEASTVTVSAGARYGDFVEQLDAAGWALHNLASLPHISVAGAISTGTHGSGDVNGSLATAVSAIEFVAADGTLLTMSRSDPEFAGMVVSLGMIGVLTRVTLDIQPTFLMRQDVFERLPWSVVYDGLDAITSSAYSVSQFTRWGPEGVTQAWLKSRMDAVGPAVSSGALPGGTRADRPLHPLPGGPASTTTEQGGLAGPWWNRLPHFRLEFTPSNGEELQTEYLVPRENVLEALDAVRALAPRFVEHLFVSELRTVAADDLWLSPSHGTGCVGIHFTWLRNVPEVRGILPALDDALNPLGGRPHWGKLFETDPARLAALYPRMDDFRALVTRLDPSGTFRNRAVTEWLGL
ncbi:MAG: hypothetical protein RI885_2146 [Actinomycetota bacterium]|jgi:xylitol oxidase